MYEYKLCLKFGKRTLWIIILCVCFDCVCIIKYIFYFIHHVWFVCKIDVAHPTNTLYETINTIIDILCNLFVKCPYSTQNPSATHREQIKKHILQFCFMFFIPPFCRFARYFARKKTGHKSNLFQIIIILRMRFYFLLWQT